MKKIGHEQRYKSHILRISISVIPIIYNIIPKKLQNRDTIVRFTQFCEELRMSCDLVKCEQFFPDTIIENFE